LELSDINRIYASRILQQFVFSVREERREWAAMRPKRKLREIGAVYVLLIEGQTNLAGNGEMFIGHRSVSFLNH
jgi:hypothetical protein